MGIWIREIVVLRLYAHEFRVMECDKHLVFGAVLSDVLMDISILLCFLPLECKSLDLYLHSRCQ